MFCGLWCAVRGLWFVDCGLGLWFVVCGLWFVVCGWGVAPKAVSEGSYPHFQRAQQESRKQPEKHRRHVFLLDHPHSGLKFLFLQNFGFRFWLEGFASDSSQPMIITNAAAVHDLALLD